MTHTEALAILKTGVNVFLTGEPGSGKTYTVQRYVDYVRSCGIEPAITASTGIAATHIGGMTIHAWSGIGVKSRLSDHDLDAITQKERVVRRVLATPILIIDEISVLSADTLSSVDAVCRAIRQSDEPFGGMQTVLVGDFFQLPPIQRRDEQGDGQGDPPRPAFAYLSDTWQQLRPVVCYLSEQHRQEDPAFLEALSAVRRGRVTDTVRACFEGRTIDPPEDDAITKLFPHNADVDRLNDAALQSLPEAPLHFQMHVHGRDLLVDTLKRSCLSPEVLTLKLGAKVMFTKNNLEGRYVNGTTGEIIGFSEETGYPIVKTRDGIRIEAEPDDWSIEDRGKILASITQIPLRLAWAITVHKSQGMSLDAAVIDLSQAFEYGQGYVALSRVRRLDGLYLLGINERALQVHPDVTERDSDFREQSEQAREAIRTTEKSQLTTQHEAFVRACGGTPGKGRQKRGEKSKPGATYEATKELVARRLSLEQMAEERGLKVSTIVSHLEKLAAKNDIDTQRDLAHIAPKGDRFMKARTALEEIRTDDGAMPLSLALAKLDNSFTYQELRLARLFVRHVSKK